MKLKLVYLHTVTSPLLNFQWQGEERGHKEVLRGRVGGEGDGRGKESESEG